MVASAFLIQKYVEPVPLALERSVKDFFDLFQLCCHVERSRDISVAVLEDLQEGRIRDSSLLLGMRKGTASGWCFVIPSSFVLRLPSCCLHQFGVQPRFSKDPVAPHGH